MNLITELDTHEEDQSDVPVTEVLLPEDIRQPLRPRSAVPVDTLALVVIAMGVVVYMLYSARAIMFPLVLACFIALPLRPLMRWMTAIRFPKFVSAGLLMAGCLTVLLAAIFWLSAPATEWLADAPAKLGAAETKLRDLVAPFHGINAATEHIETMATTSESPGTLKVEVQQPRLSSTVLSATGDFAIGAMIAISLAFLLLVFGDEMLKSIIAALPTRRNQRQLEQMFFDAERTISTYLLTYTIINIGLGAIIGTGLWMMGMPNPVLWGVMAAALNYIPFLGLIAGTGIVFIAALLSFDSVAYALIAPAIYLAVNGVEANIVTPMLLGRSMKLNTIAIFVAIVAGGWMWGIGGAIIAVPALAVLKIACERSDSLKPLSAFLATE